MTMDFEAGYGDPGETARRAIEKGVVGGNLEDQMKPLDDAVAAVEAVLAAGRDAGIDFVLNARTDAFVRAPRDADRGRAGRGGDPPGPGVPRGGRAGRVRAGRGRSARRSVALVDALGPQRLSVISVPRHSLPVRELQELGVARVSTGPFTQRVALTALQDATAELVAGGSPAPGHPQPELTDVGLSGRPWAAGIVDPAQGPTPPSGSAESSRAGSVAGAWERSGAGSASTRVVGRHSRSRRQQHRRSTTTVAATPAPIAAPYLTPAPAVWSTRSPGPGAMPSTDLRREEVPDVDAVGVAAQHRRGGG